MRRILLCTTCAGLIVLSGMQLHAQIKGDPELKATAQMPAIQKQGSKISPELQRVYDNTANARKAQPSGEKPMTTNDALDKYLQVRGDKIVVDITVKDNMATAKAALQKLGLQITGVYGRVISGLIPINALPQLGNIKAIQYARPALKTNAPVKTRNCF